MSNQKSLYTDIEISVIRTVKPLEINMLDYNGKIKNKNRKLLVSKQLVLNYYLFFPIFPVKVMEYLKNEEMFHIPPCFRGYI